jgi:hypothetical protein
MDGLLSSDKKLLKKIRIFLIKIILDLIYKSSLDSFHYAQKLPDFAILHLATARTIEDRFL